MLAVTNGHKDVVQVLVDYGTQLDCTDKHMCTALHRAVSRINQQSCHLLMYYRLYVGLMSVLKYCYKLMLIPLQGE